MKRSHFLLANRLIVTRLVPVAIVLAFWLLRIRPVMGLLLGGTALALAGQGLRMWAAGHLVKDRVLTTSGPFAFTRHPLYLGSAMIGLGLCLASGIWWTWVIVAAVFVLFYLPTATYEEHWLRATYGESYERYHQAVPGIAIRFSPYRAPDAAAAVKRSFSWSHMMGNREHQTMVATLLLLAALWLRLLAVGAGG